MTSQARQLADKAVVPTGRKNLIINGAMNVAQRGTTVSITNSIGYTLDRFQISRGDSYNFDVDVSQSSDAPTGFVNSLKIDVQATSTPSGSDNAVLEQKIESQNTTHLEYGSSSGKYIVASFWVKSNKTGTYGFTLLHSGKTRNFVNSYTINSANTWEKKTIIVNPDTAGAAFDDDNLAGLRAQWHLSTGPNDLVAARDWADDGSFRSVTGQVNLLDSTSNEFYITGVQLEVGTVATEFEHRSYGEELTLCQRYFYKTQVTVYGADYGANSFTRTEFPVEMRTTPTVTGSNNKTILANYHSTQRIQYYLSGNASALAAGATADAEF